MKSNFLNLNAQDLVKGFVVAFLSAALTGLVAILESSALPSLDDLQKAAVVGVTAGLSYLVKNFLTNSHDALLKKD
jgi:hypothetical protein